MVGRASARSAPPKGWRSSARPHGASRASWREMGPGDAARAAAVLSARRLIPMGYGEEGGFPLRWHALKPVERFIKACAERGIDRGRIVALEPGESWHYYK